MKEQSLNKTVSIFGSGEMGKKYYEYLIKMGFTIKYFFDNDSNKWGTRINNIEVLNPIEIVKHSEKIFIASMWEKDIITQLEKMSFYNYTSLNIFEFEKQYFQWKQAQINGQKELEFFQKNNLSKSSKWNVPKHLLNSSEDWAIALKSIYEEKVSFPASLSPFAGELYRALILNIAPTTIVEIGIFMGASSIWAGSAIQDLEYPSKIHSIDLFNNKDISLNHLNYVQEKIGLAKLDKIITLHKLNSHNEFEDFLPILNNKKIDFLFIDGDHSPRGATLDFLNFGKYLSTGGYILLHDIFPQYCGWEGPCFLIDEYIKNNDSYELCQLYTTPNNYGLALIRKLK